MFLFAAIIGHVSAENGLTSETGSSIEANSLSFFYAQSIQGDYVAAGVGLQNSSSGTITISGIPAGSSISKAYLYWNILNTTENLDFKTGEFNSNYIIGDLIGSNTSPCRGTNYTWSYRKEVTTMVTGNGTYSVSGFSSEGIREGASLVIIYTNPSSLNHDIVIYDGADSIHYTVSSVGTLMNGFTANGVSARTTYIVADGQTSTDSTYFNGNLIATNPFSGSDGNSWDTRTYNVSSYVFAGATSASMKISRGTDCLVHIAQVLSVTTTNEDTNTPPVADAGGPYTVNEGELLQFTVTAIDPDGDALTYSATNLPSGASFDPATRNFSWTPDYTQAGSYTGIHFTVTDGILADGKDVTITVNNVNRAPIPGTIESKTVNEGELLQFTVTASDPDGDALTYSATNLPSGASFDPVTRNFSWIPDYSQAGSYTGIHFTVTDSILEDSKDITITVNNVNRAPVVEAGSNKIINEGDALSSSGSFTDLVSGTWTATVNYGDGLVSSHLRFQAKPSHSAIHMLIIAPASLQ